jgi:hypothetical protein
MNWTTGEIKVLMAQYPLKGTAIPELLRNHSAEGVRCCAKRLGLAVGWNDAELGILRRQYPLYGTNIQELARHSKCAIKTKAKRLGLKRRKRRIRRAVWSTDEETLLRARFPHCGAAIPELRRLHSENAIKIRASRLGLTAQVWTEAEETLLRVQYPLCGAKIAELRRKHSHKAIIMKASRLGLTKGKTCTNQQA